ncbi:hypothetical protein B0H19DRAFT_1064357 [Mycena capillaripes]|nr:hypothetical protein B0H19DRAFT_1064357 [Mycena capillaripes]
MSRTEDVVLQDDFTRRNGGNTKGRTRGNPVFVSFEESPIVEDESLAPKSSPNRLYTGAWGDEDVVVVMLPSQLGAALDSLGPIGLDGLGVGVLRAARIRLEAWEEADRLE